MVPQEGGRVGLSEESLREAVRTAWEADVTFLTTRGEVAPFPSYNFSLRVPPNITVSGDACMRLLDQSIQELTPYLFSGEKAQRQERQMFLRWHGFVPSYHVQEDWKRVIKGDATFWYQEGYDNLYLVRSMRPGQQGVRLVSENLYFAPSAADLLITL